MSGGYASFRTKKMRKLHNNNTKYDYDTAVFQKFIAYVVLYVFNNPKPRHNSSFKFIN